MSEELIHNYEARLSASVCQPGADWYRVFIKLEDDISEVLPYLNAELERPTDYRHKDGFLLWKYRDKIYAFRPKEIAITPIFDNEEGQILAKTIIETVNNIWKRKDQITPSLEGKKPLPKVLDILKLLPRSNCKKCGFPTCMAFSAELRADFTKLSSCPYLSEQDFKKVVPDHQVEPQL
jgi:ArsR family metal-binding transcriptional regulator